MRHTPLSTARCMASAASICLLAALLAACSVLGGGGALGRKYVVFFSAGSASLDGPARRVVAHAADAAANNPALNVQVASFAAAHGSLSADQALSARRGDVVASALRADGVAANRIVLDARQPSNEDPGVAAHRVEIDFSN